MPRGYGTSASNVTRLPFFFFEQRLKDGLVKSPPDLPPPPGFEVNDLDDSRLVDLWVDWGGKAKKLLDSLAKTDGLTITEADDCLTVHFYFQELRLRPVPMVQVQVTGVVSAAARVVMDGDCWTLHAITDRGEPCHRTYKRQKHLGYLTRQVTAQRNLGKLAFPIAVLEALSQPERETPAARLVAIGVEGAVWDVAGQEYTLPAFLVSVLKDRSIDEQLDHLGVPDDIRTPALRLLHQSQVPGSGNVQHGVPAIALPASEDPDQDVIEALKGLGYNAQFAKELEQLARTQFTSEMGLEEKVTASLLIRDQQL